MILGTHALSTWVMRGGFGPIYTPFSIHMQTVRVFICVSPLNLVLSIIGIEPIFSLSKSGVLSIRRYTFILPYCLGVGGFWGAPFFHTHSPKNLQPLPGTYDFGYSCPFYMSNEGGVWVNMSNEGGGPVVPSFDYWGGGMWRWVGGGGWRVREID